MDPPSPPPPGAWALPHPEGAPPPPLDGAGRAYATHAVQTELTLAPLAHSRLRGEGFKGFCPTCGHRDSAEGGPSGPAPPAAPLPDETARRAVAVLEAQERLRAAAAEVGVPLAALGGLHSQYAALLRAHTSALGSAGGLRDGLVGAVVGVLLEEDGGGGTCAVRGEGAARLSEPLGRVAAALAASAAARGGGPTGPAAS